MGLSLTLIVVGAVLAWAITATSKDIDIEVTGYILAKTAGVTGGSLNKWPTSLQQLSEVNTRAGDELNQLFKSEKSHAELVDFLNVAQSQVMAQIANSTSSTAKGLDRGRGRIPAWRPKCERDQADLPNIPSGTYKETREHAHARFLEMLKRYRKFQKATGLDRIPHGYKGDPELRKWAAALRGKFKQGRLPEWQVDKLNGNALLAPAIPRSEWKRSAE